MAAKAIKVERQNSVTSPGVFGQGYLKQLMSIWSFEKFVLAIFPQVEELSRYQYKLLQVSRTRPQSIDDVT